MGWQALLISLHIITVSAEAEIAGASFFDWNLGSSIRVKRDEKHKPVH